ncbi:MAG: response regulator [Pseudomonadota bacterium]|nr:response regulator [Pseudomonadota bacterium]
MTILYVEDNEHLRETIGMLMEGDGREVVLCASGEEAIACCEQQRFDLVVTDVSLPGISGTDLARRLLRADPGRWLVLCSGYDFVDSVRQFGPNVRSLRKPFELEELDALIAEVAASKA